MRLKIVGHHPRAHGSECVIFGYVGADGRGFRPIRPDMREGGPSELSASGSWDARPMRPGLGTETAPALVGMQAGADQCRTTGRLIVLSHSWSGQLQINNIDRKYTVDLYSDVTRLLLLDLVAEIMVDVSAIAHLEDGAIRLPDLTQDIIIGAIVEHRAWFRFLAPDADFSPGLLRRALAWRQPRTDAFKLQIVSRLLPELSTPPAAPALSAPISGAEQRDEMRLLAAAVEGLALRATAPT